MTFKVSITANCDDVFLAWDTGMDIPNCLGFDIERNLNGQVTTLENRVGFKCGSLPDHSPSTDYPFQRLAWTDHSVNCGDKVSYRITARVGTPNNLSNGLQSEWTKEITLSPNYGDVDAYFNRGVVLSQFMGNLMKKNGWSVGDIKKHAQELNDKTREFLSGELRLALLRLLDEVIADKSLTLNAALFELNDEELLGRLVQVGQRLNIVLANGAAKKKGDDENADARQRLKVAGANVIDRMCAPGFLGHNKFLIVSQGDKPAKVWTGSANWQPTGLCTQANNGILVNNAALARCYLDAWDRIAAAGDTNGGVLTQGNFINPPKIHELQNGAHAFVQFTSVPQPGKNETFKAIDIHWLLDLIAGAKQSLLFAMFMPGADIFNAAVGRGKDIFVRGVANTFPKQGADTSQVGVDLVDNGKSAHSFLLNVVEPQGIAHPFSAWAEEVTREQFGAIGHAIIHSKVLVIDAFGLNPTIVTGSHNFSKTASSSNDENFIVITGNRALAQAFAVNVLGLYDHYRWRKYVLDFAQSGKQTWGCLSNDPNWLKQYRASVDRRALLGMLGI